MTITEIAAQMGVTPETLVREVVAPETTANQYIVEHYGGGQNDD